MDKVKVVLELSEENYKFIKSECDKRGDVVEDVLSRMINTSLAPVALHCVIMDIAQRTKNEVH